jgi:hypothetical protein
MRGCSLIEVNPVPEQRPSRRKTTHPLAARGFGPMRLSFSTDRKTAADQADDQCASRPIKDEAGAQDLA